MSDTESITSDSSSDKSSISEKDLQHTNLELYGKSIKNNFYILTEIGRGAFSIVWLAYHKIKDKFYALKVHHPSDYISAKEEKDFNNRLPNNKLLNKMIDNFTILKNRKKYLCIINNLYCGDLDGLLRNGNYNNGFDEKFVIKVIYQVLQSLEILHNKVKVFHGDIKPDNILLKGLNILNSKLITDYRNHKLFNELKNIIDPKKGVKIHSHILKDIVDKSELDDVYECNKDYIDNPEISLSDFGNFCDEDDEFNEEFGTRYYRAPEILLIYNCNYKVDIWALGCTCFELLTGEPLFRPKKNKYNTTHQHLMDIINLVSPISKKMIKKSKVKKKYFTKKYKLKDFIYQDTSLENVFKKYNIYNNQIIDFLKKCLIVKPSLRYSASKLLKHPLFNEIK